MRRSVDSSAIESMLEERVRLNLGGSCEKHTPNYNPMCSQCRQKLDTHLKLRETIQHESKD